MIQEKGCCVHTTEEYEKHPTLFPCYADYLHEREETGCSHLEPGKEIKAEVKSLALEGIQGK